MLGVFPESPSLKLGDEAGKVRAALRIYEDRRPNLSLWDEGGKVVWETP